VIESDVLLREVGRVDGGVLAQVDGLPVRVMRTFIGAGSSNSATTVRSNMRTYQSVLFAMSWTLSPT
jgi:hypothetical protein